MHKPLISNYENCKSRQQRLERCFEIYKIGSEIFDFEKRNILKLRDHKGILFVLWDNIPTSEEMDLIKTSWSIQYEYEVKHLISNEQEL